MPLLWTTAPLQLNLPIQRRTFSHLVLMMHEKRTKHITLQLDAE